ncbi:stabilization of polarity axis-domain-containing protein [Obelidium mucronatum]|nr:stabilization of polarity axis-domain-containing protein [Obelidium mucronatum]
MPRDPLAPLPHLYCINHVRTLADKTRGLSLVSPFPWVHAFLPLVKNALDHFMTYEKIAVITGLFQTINSIDIATIPRLTTAERIVMRSVYDSADMFHEFVEAHVERGRRRGAKSIGMIDEEWDGKHFPVNIRFNEVAYNLAVPLSIYPEEVGEFSLVKFITTFSALDAIFPPEFPDLRWRNSAPYFWHPHLDSGSQTHPIVFLMNAVLSEKRIVFFGDGRSGSDVASYVHAAAALGSGGGSVLTGVMGRCFCVVAAKDLQGLQAVPGFIAGTADPAVVNQIDLYDILCDINSGKISLSPRAPPASQDGLNTNRPPAEAADIEWMRQGFWLGDSEFMLEVISAIQNDHSEYHVRQIIYDHVQRFVDVVAAFELEAANTSLVGRPPAPQVYPGIDAGVFFKDETVKNAEFVMLRNRIEGWKISTGYFKYLQNRNGNLQKTYLPSTFPLKAMLDQIYKSEPSIPASLLVQMLLFIQDTILPGPDGAQTELLAILGTKGIQLFAAGMMHERWEIRRACTRILWRLDWHLIGTNYIQNLNPFYRLCYSRTSHLLLSQPDDDPIVDPSKPSNTAGATESPRSAGLSGNAPPSRAGAFGGGGSSGGGNRNTLSKGSIRMSLMFEERNANRVVFNNVKPGYMRGSVLSSTGLAGLRNHNSNGPPSPGMGSGGPRSSTGSGLRQAAKVPLWMQEAKAADSASIASGRSGGSGRSGKPVDMSDLDNMMRNVEKMGFNTHQQPSSPRIGGGGMAPSRLAPTTYESSDDEDMDNMERGRGLESAGKGLSSDNLFVNTQRGPAAGMAPRSPGVPGMGMGMPQPQQQQAPPQQIQRSMSAGPPGGRGPRGPSSNAGFNPNLGTQQQQQQQPQQPGGPAVRGPRMMPGQMQQQQQPQSQPGQQQFGGNRAQR